MEKRITDASVRVREAEARCVALAQERQATTKDLKAQRRARRRAEDRAWSVALAVFCHTCPNASLPLQYLMERCDWLALEQGIESIQHALEEKYLAMSVAEINAILEKPFKTGAGTVEDARRFLLDAGVKAWITAKNTEQGIAPSFQMLARQRQDVAKSLSPRGSCATYASGAAACKKWCQRFRKRLGLSLGTIAARTVLAPDVLAGKVTQDPNFGQHRPKIRNKNTGVGPKTCPDSGRSFGPAYSKKRKVGAEKRASLLRLKFGSCAGGSCVAMVSIFGISCSIGQEALGFEFG